jgi:leucyl/phenylalanyl-tRNA--protein transferase|tara:strand:+ start:1714 stop:2412 length:699 start_codon:yes stop_codon:yes gene_type:complete
MPIYQLTDELIFPHPSLAEDGILAIGGDLSPERLILAYSNGIFPWYNEGEPIIWHAPNPRFVLKPKDLKISKSMKQVIQKNTFQISLNQAFEQVIRNCQKVSRRGQRDTWITEEMLEAYHRLYHLGLAHSVEVWQDHELVGGLYGINLGTVFFGESMFHKTSNASKYALIQLIEAFPFSMIDCQVYTKHLASIGASTLALSSFTSLLVKESNKKNLLSRESSFTKSDYTGQE